VHSFLGAGQSVKPKTPPDWKVIGLKSVTRVPKKGE